MLRLVIGWESCLLVHPAVPARAWFDGNVGAGVMKRMKVRSLLRSLLETVAVAAVYYITARLGQLLAISPGNVTAVWFPSGIMLALVLLRGYRVLPGVFLGAFAGNAWAYFDASSISGLTATVFCGTANGVGNVLCTGGAAYLIQRTTGTRNPFRRSVDVAKFILFGALLGPTVSATFGVTALCMAGFLAWDAHAFAWLTWWTAEGLGVLTITPALVVWATSSWRSVLPFRSLEKLVFLLLLLAGPIGLWNDRLVTRPLHLSLFVITSLLLWGAFRLGRRLTFLAILLVSGIAIVTNATGRGPFLDLERSQALLELQCFLAILTGSILVVTTVVFEHREMYESLQERTDVTQTLLDSMPCVALLIRPGTREIVASNKAAADIGAVPGRCCYASWWRRKEPCPWCQAPKLWASGEDQHLEIEGAQAIWDAHWIRVSDDVYMHYAFNITERKKVEKQLSKSLREKEVLLREVHHRVKNNMQVISSLLNLQAAQVKEPRFEGMVRDLQDRVRSMALIHEKLCQSRDLAEIDFRQYAENLTSYLLQSYEDTSGKVALELDVEAVPLGIDFALPCGLIINELLSNALKHGFLDRETGSIRVGFHVHDGFRELTVSDNGVGFPHGVDYRTTSTLGLQLVIALVEQLEGEIELDHDNGTAFTITFAGS